MDGSLRQHEFAPYYDHDEAYSEGGSDGDSEMLFGASLTLDAATIDFNIGTELRNSSGFTKKNPENMLFMAGQNERPDHFRLF